jgi:hypothetical protein
MIQPTESTLDEPIHATLLRDFKAIGRKIAIVAIPWLGRDNELRDWDLWGPLLLCLILAMILGRSAADSQKAVVFTGVFALVWLGSAIVTLNAKFLGAKLSFFQIVCVTGYCIAPLVLAAILGSLIGSKVWYVKVIIVLLCWAWATYAALRFFRGTVRKQREFLVVYPLCLFFSFMSWMIAVGV